MRKIRPATPDDVRAVDQGVELLKAARDLFVQAGAPNTADRVRAAIISAGGAQRHVRHRVQRANIEA